MAREVKTSRAPRDDKRVRKRSISGTRDQKRLSKDSKINATGPFTPRNPGFPALKSPRAPDITPLKDDSSLFITTPQTPSRDSSASGQEKRVGIAAQEVSGSQQNPSDKYILVPGIPMPLPGTARAP
ncbi:hypothetical protein B7463_g12500, partial [Scytalidium lignicola]